MPTSVTSVLQLLAGFGIIAANLAVLALAGYLLWWISLVAAGRFPMIGRRHRHKNWDALNRP
jgi:hypothetical protein